MSVLFVILVFVLLYIIPRIGLTLRKVIYDDKKVRDLKNERNFGDTVVGFVVYSLIFLGGYFLTWIDRDILYFGLFFPVFLFLFPIVGSLLRWLMFYRNSKTYVEVYDGGHIVDMYLGLFVFGVIYLILDFYALVPSDWSLLSPD